MKISALAMMCLVLAGCASNSPAPDNKTEIPAASALTTKKCEPVEKALVFKDLGDALVYITELQIRYIECAMVHDALIKEAGGKIKLSK